MFACLVLRQGTGCLSAQGPGCGRTPQGLGGAAQLASSLGCALTRMTSELQDL